MARIRLVGGDSSKWLIPTELTQFISTFADQVTDGPGPDLVYVLIGEVVPKGFEEPVRLYEVRWRENG